MKSIIAFPLLFAAGLGAQTAKPEIAPSFDCYVQSAETRMEARKPFLLADADAPLHQQLVRGQKIRTLEAEGPNPHKLPGGQLYDLIGAVFIPGTTLDRLVAMLQDYDHRAQYFPETISASKLLCLSGNNHFQYSMRMKEPAIIDVTSDVAWERLDAHRWRCRSVSIQVAEAGKEHGYLRRLNSYWRFVETSEGVFVESETITLSDEFSGITRFVGAAMGISPEKSLRHSLTSMRESVLKPGLQVPKLPEGLPRCPASPSSAACSTGTGDR